MIIKNNKFHVIFIDGLFASIAFFLVSLAYFLGFEITSESLLFYMLSILIVIVLYCTIIIIYVLVGRTYTKITSEKILVTRKGKVLTEIDTRKIKYCKYSSIWNQLLLDTKGGYYRVFYGKDSNECLFISLSKKQASQADRILKHYD